ncbi:MAG: hypothetical protein B6I31_00965 [Desulfobacteraceae bacterium 4572_19]|nr:MAG: hypothetical protein B6I31_00965 [Desulfobacteraceae bacterium 4572_19]
MSFIIFPLLVIYRIILIKFFIKQITSHFPYILRKSPYIFFNFTKYFISVTLCCMKIILHIMDYLCDSVKGIYK